MNGATSEKRPTYLSSEEIERYELAALVSCERLDPRDVNEGGESAAIRLLASLAFARALNFPTRSSVVSGCSSSCRYAGSDVTLYGGGGSFAGMNGPSVSLVIQYTRLNDEGCPATMDMYFSHCSWTSRQFCKAPLIESGVKYAGLFLCGASAEIH